MAKGFWARLLDDGSPYSWQEVLNVGGRWRVPTDARAGMKNAWEANGTAGLAGKIVWMCPRELDEYCFLFTG